MSDPDEFERDLARHPFREPPAAWRESILARADECLMRHNGASRLADVGLIGPWWERLWSGWSVAVAAWVLILGLNQSGGSPGSGRTPRAPLSPEAEAFFAEQRRAAFAASGNGPATEAPGHPVHQEAVPSASEPRAEVDLWKRLEVSAGLGAGPGGIGGLRGGGISGRIDKERSAS